ncbi:hypothetical protein [Sporosarcina highlanderae]|uniref:Uncharacterized protein n=1 Tax=Sporosarcina highlanderae TaxID=3035916 RepID=A0ABT8JVE2_9BACL|nr:hypothetical protein [Sporosarcina highlanderae]MDN4609145.1 hypothetical protein [Sporosarcina highlanderae]
MSGKVKLTQKQSEGIEAMLRSGNWTHEQLIEKHARGMEWSGMQASKLNGIPLLTFVDALRIGYEVEEEYKVGDWVFILNVSKIGKVVRVGNDFVEVDNGMVPSFGFFRHATPEEIKAEKERRVWKEIGREVGEFRDGDRGIHASGTSVIRKDYIKECYDGGTLKGFYPAESFISITNDPDD